jgi:hypothetical protein
MRYLETEVLLVELRHQPGALAKVCEALGNEHINIDYCYVSSGGRNGRVHGVFKVSNTEKVKALLGSSVANRRPQKRIMRNPRNYSGRGNTAARAVPPG